MAVDGSDESDKIMRESVERAIEKFYENQQDIAHSTLRTAARLELIALPLCCASRPPQYIPILASTRGKKNAALL